MLKYTLSNFIILIKEIVIILSTTYNFIFVSYKKIHRKAAQYQCIKYEIVPLSPPLCTRLSIVRRKILVLDLDETLIHSVLDGMIRPTVKPSIPPDFILKVEIDRHPVRFFVHKRPHVDYFLDIVSQWFDLVVYTASLELYGAAVSDKLDRGRDILKQRYYRQHCHCSNNSYSKDLFPICTELQSIFILDNSPGAYRDYPDNAIPIKSWFSDPKDTELLNLLPILDALRFVKDVRTMLSRNLHRHPILPLIPILGAIFAGLGAPGGVAGGVATAVQKSKKAQKSNTEKEKIEFEKKKLEMEVEKLKPKEEQKYEAEMSELNTSCPSLSYVIDLSSMEISPLYKGTSDSNIKSSSCNSSFMDNNFCDSVSGQGDTSISKKTQELFKKVNRNPLSKDDIERKLKEANDRRRSILNDKKRKSEMEINKISMGIETRSKQINEIINKMKIEIEEDIATKLEKRKQFLCMEQMKAKREIEKVEGAKKAIQERSFEEQIKRFNNDMEKKENLRFRRISNIVDNCKSHIDHVKSIREKRKSQNC